MLRAALISVLVSLATGAMAQVVDGIDGATTEEARTRIGTGARLKALDKFNGQVSEFDMRAGGSAQIGRLVITLRECRYPDGDQDGDAYAFLVITEPSKSSEPLFSGWMVASSPALNALDHFRYDVWVMRCKTD
ncbi:MAG: DUF2155 domain-containing protein [Pseudooceanicola sp.]|nr:DUF2155 domain-containing protein [Pseudooceanicola sp.]MDF1854874.1 DUF2155 domain-containing protein [Pseudooceanicola sp.]